MSLMRESADMYEAHTSQESADMSVAHTSLLLCLLNKRACVYLMSVPLAGVGGSWAGRQGGGARTSQVQVPCNPCLASACEKKAASARKACWHCKHAGECLELSAK